MLRGVLTIATLVGPASAVVQCLANNCYKETQACQQDMVCSMWLEQSTDWSSFETIYKNNPSYPQLNALYKCGEGPCASTNTYSSKDSTTKSCSANSNCEACADAGCTWMEPKCVDYCTLQATEAAQGGCKTDREQCSLGYDPNKAYGAQTGYSCNTESDCAGGQRCENGMCYNVDQMGGGGIFCSYNSDCPPGGTCQGSYCRSNYAGNQQCLYPRDCPPGCTCPYNGGWCNCARARYATEIGSSTRNYALPPPAPELELVDGLMPTVSKAETKAVEVVEKKKPVGKPSKPQMLSIFSKSDTSATLIWAPPERNFDCGTDPYRVMYKEIDTDHDHLHLAFFESGQTASHHPFITVDDLEPDQKYEFMVAAFPASNLSPEAGSKFATITFKTRKAPKKKPTGGGKKRKGNKKNKKKLDKIKDQIENNP